MVKKSSDIVLESFLGINLQKVCRVPIIAVYKNPSDYPEQYVARLWDIHKRPTRFVMVKESLESIRQNILATMTRLDPCQDDDPILVETWI